MTPDQLDRLRLLASYDHVWDSSSLTTADVEAIRAVLAEVERLRGTAQTVPEEFAVPHGKQVVRRGHILYQAATEKQAARLAVALNRAFAEVVAGPDGEPAISPSDSAL